MDCLWIYIKFTNIRCEFPPLIENVILFILKVNDKTITQNSLSIRCMIFPSYFSFPHLHMKSHLVKKIQHFRIIHLSLYYLERKTADYEGLTST